MNTAPHVQYTGSYVKDDVLYVRVSVQLPMYDWQITLGHVDLTGGETVKVFDSKHEAYELTEHEFDMNKALRQRTESVNKAIAEMHKHYPTPDQFTRITSPGPTWKDNQNATGLLKELIGVAMRRAPAGTCPFCPLAAQYPQRHVNCKATEYLRSLETK